MMMMIETGIGADISHMVPSSSSLDIEMTFVKTFMSIIMARLFPILTTVLAPPDSGTERAAPSVAVIPKIERFGSEIIATRGA